MLAEPAQVSQLALACGVAQCEERDACRLISRWRGKTTAGSFEARYQFLTWRRMEIVCSGGCGQFPGDTASPSPPQAGDEPPGTLAQHGTRGKVRLLPTIARVVVGCAQHNEILCRA